MQKEQIDLNFLWRQYKRQMCKYVKMERKLLALEQNDLDQQLQINNAQRRIENDFPVQPWNDSEVDDPESDLR